MTPGRILCGHSDVPIVENGQSPCMRPSGPYDIETKPKNVTSINDVSMSGAATFLNIGDMFILQLFCLKAKRVGHDRDARERHREPCENGTQEPAEERVE